MATLLVGSKYLGKGATNKIEVIEGDAIQFRGEGLSHLYNPDSRLLKRFTAAIDAVESDFAT